jgi:hypothetical protein|tara:strand:+ start:699 stop:1208 length:510 start_codon:yes stop_codon:yes gene_type:complete
MLLHSDIKVGLPKEENFIPLQRLDRLGVGDKVFCIGTGSIDNITKDTDDSQEYTITSNSRVTGNVQTIELVDQSDANAWQERRVSLYIESSSFVYARHPYSGSFSWIGADKMRSGYHCYTQGRHKGLTNVITEVISTETTGSLWLDVQGVDHCFARNVKGGPVYLIREM